ncbi:MAG: hypothetical protein K0S86_5827, partial [Geminicoccaceae bacterium]|nr:hypothetical protein [Geminicoccaceae bacterium]
FMLHRVRLAMQDADGGKWARRSESDPLAARKVIHLGA